MGEEILDHEMPKYDLFLVNPIFQYSSIPLFRDSLGGIA
jgi:hypothetical protein